MSVQVSQTWQLIEYFNKVTYFIDRRASQHFFCFYFPQCHKFICLINTQWNVDVCTSSAIRTPITSYLFIWHFKWQISLKQATLLDQTWKAVPTWLSIRITPSLSTVKQIFSIFTSDLDRLNRRNELEKFHRRYSDIHAAKKSWDNESFGGERVVKIRNKIWHSDYLFGDSINQSQGLELFIL